MLKKIQERIFPFLIATSALSVSASAAFYSVSGLSKLFAGASLAVIIMATTLEASKLVIASLLYQYRKTLPRGLKTYLTIAAAVLVMITSMGIYGFLSAAYQETANKSGYVEKQVAVLELKKERFDENRESLLLEKNALDESVASLREGLANNKIQYRDKETGQIITTTSSSTRRSLEKQLTTATENREKINLKLEVVTDSITSIDLQILDLETDSDLAGELGPLKYIAGLTGIPMDKVINYLLLAIVFVFDPLAISLVIAANFAFEKLAEKRPKKEVEEEVLESLTPKEDNTISYSWPGAGELVDLGATLEEQAQHTEWEDEGMWTEEEMEDFNNQFNADHLTPDEEEDEEEFKVEIKGSIEPEAKSFEEIKEKIYDEFIPETPKPEVKEEEVQKKSDGQEEATPINLVEIVLTPENEIKVDDWDYNADQIEIPTSESSMTNNEIQLSVQEKLKTNPEILTLIDGQELIIESSSLAPVMEEIEEKPQEEEKIEQWTDTQKRKIHKKRLRDNYGYIPGARGNAGTLGDNLEEDE